MSIYAIGDVQGCYQELMLLLEKIHFSESTDLLWFAGDLVNRGKNSLEVLRFIKSLGNRQVTVLGNHDFHLLAVSQGHQRMHSHDTFQDILAAPDRDELLFWLRQQKLMHYNESIKYIMVHAGISPQWNIGEALSCAKEVENLLKSNDYKDLLTRLYGNDPNYWQSSLAGWDRYRYIVNVFARIRYCNRDGALNLVEKGAIDLSRKDIIPWFNLLHSDFDNCDIIFGHWASLNGEVNRQKVFAIDTGCAWGHFLTAMRLEDQRRFVMPSIL